VAGFHPLGKNHRQKNPADEIQNGFTSEILFSAKSLKLKA
jgi:hypothetical protein